jgi:hypothetical protein
VVGWSRWRELDELHGLAGVRHTLTLIAKSGRIPLDQVDLLAHMVLASVSEAALHIARSDDQERALVAGQASLDLLLDRLVTPPPAARAAGGHGGATRR